MSTPHDATAGRPGDVADLQARLAAAEARAGALADVLEVINRSPGSAQPVFDAILGHAMRLCDTVCGVLYTWDGTHFHLAAHRGVPAAFADFRNRGPTRPTPRSSAARLLESRGVVHVLDFHEEETYRTGTAVDRASADLGGARSTLLVPLLRDGEVQGLISTYRQEVRAFDDTQIALLEGFAAQAVIAMENARLLTEQQEALERQTATADVLAVINANPGNLAPVFDALLEKAMRLCGAAFGELYEFDGERFFPKALRGVPAEYAAYKMVTPPANPGGSFASRALAGERVIHIADLAETDAYRSNVPGRRAMVDLGGARAAVCVVLLTDTSIRGSIVVYRQEPRPFSDKQIALLENFAAQAVIAMDNTRLLTEQQEALEQQQASSDILTVISTSMGDVLPVFEKILESCKRLFDGDELFVARVDEQGLLHLAAYVGRFPEAMEASFPAPLDIAAAGRAIRERRMIHYPDIGNDPDAPSAVRRMAEVAGYHSGALAPMVWQDRGIGVVGVGSSRRAFTERQLQVLQGFADQAVIAIQNTRLITEQREALERQTATAELLQVINANPGNLAPVFEVMLEKAMRLAGATFGILDVLDGEHYRSEATIGAPEAYLAFRKAGPMLASDSVTVNRFRETGKPFHVLDLLETESFRNGEVLLRGAYEFGGIRTFVGVPMMKNGAVLGIIWALRQEVRAFTDKQIALIESFAAQAVIAMENARLLSEQQQALERQTATAEVLGVINANPGNLAPVFEAILEKAHHLCDARRGSLQILDGRQLRGVAMRGMSAELADYLRGGFAAPESFLRGGGRAAQVDDLAAYSAENSANPAAHAWVELRGHRALLVPLHKDGVLLGRIVAARQAAVPFTDRQIALLENFAAQAVIAMDNARLLTELQARDEDNRRLIARQSASIDILRAISASPDDPQPVFDMIARHALELCQSAQGSIAEFDGALIHTRSLLGVDADTRQAILRTWPRRPGPEAIHGRVVLAGHSIHVRDIAVDETISARNQVLASRFGYRSVLGVPLLRDGRVIGSISLTRAAAGGFADDEVALVESFAEQAVIAISGAQALRELRVRDEDNRKLIARQSASIDILKAISASPDDAQPVFELIVRRALELCNASAVTVAEFDGALVDYRAMAGFPPDREAQMRAAFPRPPGRDFLPGRVVLAGEVVVIPDVQADMELLAPARALGSRTAIGVPILSEGRVIGVISPVWFEVRPQDDGEIALLQSFAEQAAIAIASATALRALRARTEQLARREDELRVTFENMGDGVAMFDASQRLVAWNRKFQDILDLPDDALAQGLGFADYIRVLAGRGEYGADADAEDQVRRLVGSLGERRSFERVRPNGHTVEVRNNPVADGGFVLIYADITARKRAEAEIAAARDAAEQAARTIEAAYRELKIAQANLVQAEKMASLGQLTAGIAHEIKNPLNFVNNFSDLSVELLGELTEAIAPAVATLGDDVRADVDDLTATLTGNLRKITEHGRRADGIVRSMLEHSRGSSGERRSVDLNAVVEEALNLAYHGARAQDQSFNITLERHFAAGMAPITLTPQDITRVFLNLFSNGFYAANQRAKAGADPGFTPRLAVSTRDLGAAVEIRVRDNGTGVPPAVREKLFEPFFTTKPTGEGTGLGLSISYDIVTKQHGGSIAVESEPDGFTEFTVVLPRQGMAV